MEIVQNLQLVRIVPGCSWVDNHSISEEQQFVQKNEVGCTALMLVDLDGDPRLLKHH